MKDATGSLDNIVRKVARDTKPSAYGEKLLIVEKNRDGVQISEKSSPFAGVFGKQRAFYIVANDSSESNKAEGALVYKMRHRKRDTSVDALIRYEVACPVGNERLVLKNLCAGYERPVDALHNVIEKTAASYNRSQEWCFIDDYYHARYTLRQSIAKAVEQETGLSCRPRISLVQEEQLQPFEIQPVVFSISLKECAERLALQLQTALAVDEGNKANAVLKLGREFELANLIKNSIRKYLKEQISLEAYHRDLSTTIHNEIEKLINKLLTDYGRKVDELRLTNQPVAPGSAQIEDIQCSVRCKLTYPKPVEFTVQSTLSMKLVDVGRYRLNSETDLNRWATGLLDRIVRGALYNKSSDYVLNQFDDVVDEIKRKVQPDAARLGYSVEQVVSEHNLETVLEQNQ